MKTTKIGIVGLGTVGSGVARILTSASERLTRHTGQRLELAAVVVKDRKKDRLVDLPASMVSEDLTKITGNPEITAVAHLVGGLEPARTILLKLLESGKDVITANKALLAEHGPELFDRARQLGRSIAFEAAVAGGIPIIANISQCLSANQIQSLQGILNGTSNFILTQMEEQGADYAVALKEAQRLGYAEADPAMDVDGSDAAQKLAILAHLAFGVKAQWRDIPRHGIDDLQLADLRYARELGYRIKLIASARLTPEGLELSVGPTLVKAGTPLSEVRGAYNAVSVVGDAVGKVFFHGLGAGQMPTASAVVADLIDTVVGRTAITFSTLELWSEQSVGIAQLDHTRNQGRYYLRFNVTDKPGVLAVIAGELGKAGISIAAVIQHDREECDGIVPLVVMTHEAAAGPLGKALAEIDKHGGVTGRSIKMRVLS